MIVLLILLFGVAVSAVAAEPGIMVEARQRYPWSGLVDLKFTITGDSGTKYETSFTAKDMVGDTNVVMKTIRKSNGVTAEEKEKLLPGTYNWVWDAAADLPKDFMCERVTVTGAAVASELLYMVIDLSNGSKTYLSDVPAGGWTVAHKTKLMVLRKINKGTNKAGGSMAKNMWVGIFEFTQGQAKTLGNDCGHEVRVSSTYGGLGDCKPINLARYGVSNSDDDYLCERYPPCMDVLEKQTATKENGEVHYTGYSDGSVRTVLVPYMLTRFKKVTGLSKTRLPSIPEWQYAYRAGTTTEYYSSPVSEIATYAAAELSDVGSHKPNAWGLYDMSGNVGELTSGYWSGTYASWQISCGGTYRAQESDCKVTSTGWVDYCLHLSDSSHYCFNAFRIFVEE
jgi:hypothetical protein